MFAAQAQCELDKRQNRRQIPPLRDYGKELERWSFRKREHQQLANAYGTFIAGLAEWNWFINPITFRDRAKAEDNPENLETRVIASAIGTTFVTADPRIRLWRPQSRFYQSPSPPARDRAMSELFEYLSELEVAAGTQIGWVIGEDYGSIGGRWHVHGLVAGVVHMRRKDWWEKAHQRFGRSRIEPFDAERAGAFYTAKYAGKTLGEIHFGGALFGRVEHRPIHKPPRKVIVVSAAMPKELYHVNMRQWHR